MAKRFWAISSFVRRVRRRILARRQVVRHVDHEARIPSGRPLRQLSRIEHDDPLAGPELGQPPGRRQAGEARADDRASRQSRPVERPDGCCGALSASQPDRPVSTGRRLIDAPVTGPSRRPTVGDVDPDRLQLGVLVVREDRLVAPAEAGFLEAAEGRRDVPLAEAVHRHRAGPDLARRLRARLRLPV